MKLLYAEDEPAMAEAVTDILEYHNYTVDTVYDGAEALAYAREEHYDGIILDVMMPKMDGFSVLRALREDGDRTPVLLLTAKAEIEDRISGLDLGADDYLPKPFATSELIARIKALGRRSENYSDSLQKVGNLTLDGNRYEMKAGDNSVKLTNKEYQLIELFVLHPGFVFSTEHLMDKIWGFESDSDIDVVWTHIGFVRKKLRSIGANVEIKTIRGSGYSLEVEEC